MKISKGWIVAAVVILVIIADQALKFWVKTDFYIGEDYQVTSWFHIKFIENNGMAFGLELGSKVLLTLGRILAVALLVWFILRILRSQNVRTGFLVALALITAGAAGNIFDCVFYGKIFDDPVPPATACLFPQGGGYSGWFEGQVVDMLYFPFFSFTFPEWMPGVGGEEFEFFQYIFNLADSSIFTGVCLLIFFYSHDVSEAFASLDKKKSKIIPSGEHD